MLRSGNHGPCSSGSILGGVGGSYLDGVGYFPTSDVGVGAQYSSLKLREDQTGTGETVDTPGQHIQNKDCPSQTGTG